MESFYFHNLEKKKKKSQRLIVWSFNNLGTKKDGLYVRIWILESMIKLLWNLSGQTIKRTMNKREGKTKDTTL